MNPLLAPVLPLVAAPLSLAPLGRRFAPAVTLAAAGLAFGLAATAGVLVAGGGPLIAIPGWIELDGLGAVVLLVVTFVAATAALFSWGYLDAHGTSPARVRAYCVQFNLFVFALALVPVLAQPALVWIAIEFTAVFSVLLVAFDNTQAALEAAWKYIALMFMGAAIALVGFFLLFWAQAETGGGHYSWEGLRAVAPLMRPTLVLTAFLFILVGFGTKVGLVPMHTWLPDAHSQAPSPVCALLSGVKTTAALYCILRLLPLLPAGRLDGWLQAVGLLSTGTAAVLLLQVRDYKRLFAYSTVEHMGIVCTAAGLGGAGARTGAMLQLIAHSLTKSFCFFAAGAALLLLGTREIPAVRGLIRTSPVAGAAMLFGALAIGGAPPMAVFLGEFAIIRSGLALHQYVATGLLTGFIAMAFFGILYHVSGMVFGSPAAASVPAQASGRLPAACVLALIVAGLPVLVLGLAQPGWLHALLAGAAAAITPAATP